MFFFCLEKIISVLIKAENCLSKNINLNQMKIYITIFNHLLVSVNLKNK